MGRHWQVLMTTPWHSPPHHPSIKPTLFHSLSTLIQHALAWGHSAIVPTSLCWDCVDGMLPAGTLAEAHKIMLVNMKSCKTDKPNTDTAHGAKNKQITIIMRWVVGQMSKSGTTQQHQHIDWSGNKHNGFETHWTVADTDNSKVFDTNPSHSHPPHPTTEHLLFQPSSLSNVRGRRQSGCNWVKEGKREYILHKSAKWLWVGMSYTHESILLWWPWTPAHGWCNEEWRVLVWQFLC